MARYTLLETGPDDECTYPECWGALATSQGRVRAESATLAGLIEDVDAIGHDNWWIRGPGGRSAAQSRREFRALPAVARELRRTPAGD